jgi:hypothetical protein
MVTEWGDVPQYAEAMRQITNRVGGDPFARVVTEASELALRARSLYDNFTALIAHQRDRVHR